MSFQTFNDVLKAVYRDLTQISSNPPNLKYSVKAWNIGPFYQMIANMMGVSTSELILSKTLEYRFNPQILEKSINCVFIGFENGETYIHGQIDPNDQSSIVVIELTNEIVEGYLSSFNK